MLSHDVFKRHFAPDRADTGDDIYCRRIGPGCIRPGHASVARVGDARRLSRAIGEKKKEHRTPKRDRSRGGDGYGGGDDELA